MDLRIATLHPHVMLVIRNAETLAEVFFRSDPSSAHVKSYDAWILKQQAASNRITVGDVRAINATMRARCPYSVWTQFTEFSGELLELAAIDPVWDLITMPDDEWQRLACYSRIEALLAVTLGRGRNIAVTTKTMHIKRPQLMPILDSYVVQMLGGTPTPNASQATDLIAHLRTQGQANCDALLAIQQRLAQAEPQPFERTLVRILDVLLWVSHPGAWGSAAYKHIASAAIKIETP